MDNNNKRTHFSQLPDAKEAEEMLKKESQRAPTKEKEDIQYLNFEPFLNWLSYLELSTDFLTEENIIANQVLKSAEEIKPLVISKTLDLIKRGDSKIQEIISEINHYLGEEDTPEKSDFILVFGSNDLKRVEKAVDLYNKGVSDLIVITGGQPNYKEEKVPEAVVFSRHAIKLGVPKDRILVEPNSINFADNAKSVFNLLDNLNVTYKKITTVTAWFSHRRIWAHLMKLSPDGTKFYRVNTDIDSGRFAPHEWFNNEIGINVIFNEFIKMKARIALDKTA